MAEWVEDLHPRAGKGQAGGGRFTAKIMGAAPSPPLDIPAPTARELTAKELQKYEPDWSRLEFPGTSQYACMMWTSSDFEDINRELRTSTDKEWAYGKHQHAVRGLDRAFKVTPELTEDVVVYRGMGTRHRKGDTLDVGDSWVDNGFASTSSRAWAEHFVAQEGGVLMQITIPKGTRVLAPTISVPLDPKASKMLSKLGIAKEDQELEMEGAEPELLLERGTRYTVTGVENGVVQVTVGEDVGELAAALAEGELYTRTQLRKLKGTEIAKIAESMQIGEKDIYKFGGGTLRKGLIITKILERQTVLDKQQRVDVDEDLKIKVDTTVKDEPKKKRGKSAWRKDEASFLKLVDARLRRGYGLSLKDFPNYDFHADWVRGVRPSALGNKLGGNRKEVEKEDVELPKKFTKTYKTPGGQIVNVIGNIPPAFVDRNKVYYSKLPAHVRTALEKDGISINLVESFKKHRPEIAKTRPRGWTQGTFAMAEGYYNPGRKEVALAANHDIVDGYEMPVKRNAFYHEAGHAYDHALGSKFQPFTATKEFREAHETDMVQYNLRGKKSYDYYTLPNGVGASEAFAEMFGTLMGTPLRPLMAFDIRVGFPRVMKIVKNMINNETLKPKKEAFA